MIMLHQQLGSIIMIMVHNQRGFVESTLDVCMPTDPYWSRFVLYKHGARQQQTASPFVALTMFALFGIVSITFRTEGKIKRKTNTFLE